MTLKSHEAVCPMESVTTYMTIHCPILKRLPVLYPFCSTTMGEPLSSTAIGTGHVTTAKSSFSVVFTNMLDGQELNVGGRSTIQGERRRKMMLLLSGWTNLLTKSKKLQNRMGTLTGVSLNFFFQSPAGWASKNSRSPAGFFTSPHVFIHKIFKPKKQRKKTKRKWSP